MTRPLVEEAQKEMTFALQTLEEELAEAQENGDASVQRVVGWILEDLREKLKDVAEELSIQCRISIEPEENPPRAWKDIDWSELVDSQAVLWQPSERETLADKVTRSLKAFSDSFRDSIGDDEDLLILLHHTKLVREYTDIWTIYRIAWAQREGQPVPSEDFLGFLNVSDHIVNEFYSTATKEKLDLHMPEQVPIPVFFRNEAYTRPSRTAPLPYIVIPRWGLRHIWIGNAITHEVGHNIFWNVKGLFDELLVTLILNLARRTFSYDEQRLWGQWLAEIFADLFGLLQVGPAIIRSQQRMLVHSHPDLLEDLRKNPERDVVSRLKCAYDVQHPPSYLRVWLSIEALKILAKHDQNNAQTFVWRTSEKEIKALEKRWCDFLKKSVEDVRQAKITLMADGKPLDKREVLAGDMLEQARTVLRIMLFTPLHALAPVDRNDQLQLQSLSPRSMVDVFSGIVSSPPPLPVSATGPGSGRFQGKDIRGILAAAEKAFEEVDVQDLSALSQELTRTIASLKKRKLGTLT